MGIPNEFPSETRLKKFGVQGSHSASGKDRAVDPQLRFLTRHEVFTVCGCTDLSGRTNPRSAHWRQVYIYCREDSGSPPTQILCPHTLRSTLGLGRVEAMTWEGTSPSPGRLKDPGHFYKQLHNVFNHFETHSKLNIYLKINLKNIYLQYSKRGVCKQQKGGSQTCCGRSTLQCAGAKFTNNMG